MLLLQLSEFSGDMRPLLANSAAYQLLANRSYEVEFGSFFTLSAMIVVSCMTP